MEPGMSVKLIFFFSEKRLGIAWNLNFKVATLKLNSSVH